MRWSILFFLIGVLVLQTFEAQAQQRRWNPKQRFKAAVLIGANASQMDGDNFRGYDKFGVQFGVRGTALLARHVDLNFELLFSQKGTRVESNPQALFPKKNRVLELNYAEVPILLRYKVNEDGSGVFLEGGISFARLVGNSIQEDTSQVLHTFTEIQDDFKRNELNFVAGLGHQFTPHIGLGLRTTISMTYIFDQRAAFSEQPTLAYGLNPSDFNEIRFLRNYFVTLYANYIF